MSAYILSLTYFTAPQLAGILTALAVVAIVAYALFYYKCVKGYCKLYRTYRDRIYVREICREVGSPEATAPQEPERKSEKRGKVD